MIENFVKTKSRSKILDGLNRKTCILIWIKNIF